MGTNGRMTENGTDREPTLDTVVETLRNQRRRRVVDALREDRVTDLDTLATELAAAEADTTPAELTSTQRKRVYVGLYQSHLPKMDSLGVVDFENGVVAPGPHYAATAEALGALRAALADGDDDRDGLVSALLGGVA